MALKGIDVSKWNTKLDYKRLKSVGIDFAMIRAGLGTQTDAMFASHIKAAQVAGMQVGVYWFAYALNASEAQKEADACLKVIKPYKLDLPVFYDFEYDTERYAGDKGVTYTVASRTAIIKAFCDRIESAGYDAGVYINPDYCLYKTNRGQFKKYKLWIAAWRRSDGVASFETVKPEQLPTTYTDAMIWQPGKAKLDGSGGAYVDINYGYFNTNSTSGTPTDAPTDTNSTSGTPTDAPTEKPNYKINDKYTIKAGDMYTTGQVVPDEVVGWECTIIGVKSDRILLKEVYTWVYI